jgi:hypothetical protein
VYLFVDPNFICRNQTIWYIHSEHWTRHGPLLTALVEVEADMSLDNILVGVEHVDLFVLLGLLHLLGGVVVGGALEAVIVSVELLSLGSQMNTVTAIFLDLLSATFLLGLFFFFTSVFLDSLCVFLDTVTAILRDLACMVLVAMIPGSAGAVLSVLLPWQTPQTCPWSCSVMIVG